MKIVTIYLIAIFSGLVYLLGLSTTGHLPAVFNPIVIGFTCAIIGGLGGCVYCLRGIYITVCVKKNWDDQWLMWYYIRPIISFACGAVSYLFLRAGLLVLEAGVQPNSTELGFYALAFIAGLNVDKFVSKIEDIAQAVWGIERSRASTQTTD